MATIPGPWQDGGDQGREPHRMPPQNVEAEQGVLGSILQAPHLLHAVKAVLRGPDDFFRDTHQVLYRGMLELDGEGKPLDPIALHDHLARQGRLLEVGGIDAITELMGSVPHELNAGYYAHIVREHAVKRDLIDAAAEVLRDGYANQCTAEDLLDRARRKLLRVEEEVRETTWQAPDPYGGLPAPPFPLDVLPEGLRRFVGEVAASIPCPADYAAVPCLAVAGAAIGRSVSVRLKAGWTEEANLWTAIVGMPGTAKTPALAAVTRPLYRLMNEQLQWHKLECEMVATRKREREAEKKKLGPKADLGPEEPRPTLQRVLVSDVTSETLGPRLRDNPRGLILLLDELAGWVNGFNQYKAGGGGNDQETYLALWSRQAITIDRKGQEDGMPIYVSRPFMGATGGIQPDKLDRIGVGPDGRRRNDGFMDRILFAFPAEIPMGWSWDSVSPEADREWDDAFRKLRGVEMFQPEDGSHAFPFVMDLTREALERYAAWTDQLCRETEESDFDQEMKGPYSKLRAYCARLALTLEMLWWAFDPTAADRPDRVGLRSVEAAILLCDYFAAHYRRVIAFISGNDADNPDAKALLKWASARGERQFTSKQARDNFRRRFAEKPEDLDAALRWLEERGFVRKLAVPRRGAGGRRAADVYEVNPNSLPTPESAR